MLEIVNLVKNHADYNKIISILQNEVDIESPVAYSNMDVIEYAQLVGRHRAQFYARIRLSTAMLRLESAKVDFIRLCEEWDNLKKDKPITWE